MKITRVLLIVLLISGLANSFETIAQDHQVYKNLEMTGITFSWNAAFNAVNYKVEIENQDTNEVYSKETANTTVTFENAPSGLYKRTVVAEMADGSTSIIIEDLSVL